ncbi:unnamed protein product, partial [Owenia fusiformis]
QKWSSNDGLGALIISPTRELAYQTFEVLRKVGKKHDFSAGLVIGGKFIKEESERINRTNIVICTPGRLLQHMDETAYFTAHNLQILVLDEADRILDMGFAQTMNAVIENLPTKRQTLLFSATQTKSVKDLARLSLKDPMYVSVHEHSEHSTPKDLEQSYVVTEVDKKIDLLWSFVKHHLKKKILVFLASCKQVRYMAECFKKLRPGISVGCLHGGMKQLKRVDAYDEFCRKQSALLFATDIAARGLDFPAVHWVIQLDCPEDASTYIHRAGRTARYEKGGESLLILLPSEEEGMVAQLKDRKIPIQKIDVNPSKQWSIQPKIQSMCAAEVEHKEMAQRAFVSYLRSIFLMKNKEVFDVHKVDTEAFSKSLGLAIAPKIRFVAKDKQRLEAKQNNNTQPVLSKLKNKTVSSTTNDDKVSPLDSTDNVNADSEESDNESDDESGEESDASDIDDGTSEEESDDDAGNRLKAEQLLGISHDSESETDNVETMTKSKHKKDKTKKATDKDTKVKAVKKSKTIEENKTDSKNKQQKSQDKMTNKEHSKGAAFDVSDEEDDFLTVKQRHIPGADDSDVATDEEEDVLEPEKASSKKDKKKPLSKIAIAKKALKKKIKLNTKITFDEEGKAVADYGKAVNAPLDGSEEGGIDLEVAKQWMKDQDVQDKEHYRQKIKKKHKEKRMKAKEERRRLQKEKDGNTSDNDNESLDEEMSALIDGLPDPDKHYGQKEAGEDESEADSSEDEPEEGPVQKRRKLSQKTKKSHKDSESDSDNDGGESYDESASDDNMDTELQDDEALALKLLGM